MFVVVVNVSEEVNRQASEERFATGDMYTRLNNISIRAEHRIGTWNVRGLLKPGKLSIVEKEMENHKLSILGISETHMRGKGHFKTAMGNTMYFSGTPDSSLHGVGIVVPSKLNCCVLGYNPVSERIVTLKLNTRPCALNIVQIYAPTSQCSDEEIDEFYGTLGDTLNKLPNREVTLILGDWNAKVGNSDSDSELRHVVGGYGLGERNERGTRFLDFCIDRKLSILNTFFQHHPRRLYTWKSPGDKYRNQIDYVLINTRWKTSITNVKTFPGAECGSDHNLLVAKLNIRLKAPRKYPPPKPRQLGTTEKGTFQQVLEAKLKEDPCTSEQDANSQWEHLKTHINNTLSNFMNSRNPESKKKIWISDSTWELIERRKEIKIKGLQNPDVVAEYSKLCKSIDRHCRRDKNCFLQNVCTDIEQHSVKFQTADLFKKVRLLSRQVKPKIWVVEDEDGKLLHDFNDIADRWRRYCEELYWDDQRNSVSSPDWNSLTLEPNILRSEITSALHHIKPNKAPGPDDITAEILKSLGDTAINSLHTICNKIWTTGVWPRDWTETVILPLHKKGSTRNCSNYRTLSLMSHASKILLHILNNRIRYYLNWQIPQEQAGFVKGKGTREQILNVRQLVEKAYEYNTPVIMCFVDFSKAFDCVKWNKLWTVLQELGVPYHLIALLQMLYVHTQAKVKIDRTISNPLNLGKGVRQGCILSPILFNVYGEYIMRLTCNDWNGGVRIGGIKVTNLRYADDTTLIASSEEEMHRLLRRMEVASAGLGLSINKSKTKLMVVDRTNQLDLRGLLDLQIVENFIYLGSNICNNGSCEGEIRRRIGMAKSAMSQLQRIWRDRKISIKTKIKLVRTLIFSIFLYGAETWTIKSADRNRIDAFEMWCWRKMLQIPWTAHRTNVSILKQLHIQTRLSTTCLKRVLEYFDHIARKDNDNLERLMITGKIEGKRPRGRSPIRWSDQIRTSLGITFKDALKGAENRKRWRDIIRKALSGGHDPQH
ncbi:unnamed protein product [Euphydryas editha]|uniref:Reverse transcriptase domain-containing protein n=1 Tax=Euphydryas editha TaxID=104508 RepID=A0AAU9V8Z9_EUPED|nr:unnamed protein product [Euphydryas editha]